MTAKLTVTETTLSELWSVDLRSTSAEHSSPSCGCKSTNNPVIVSNRVHTKTIHTIHGSSPVLRFTDALVKSPWPLLHQTAQEIHPGSYAAPLGDPSVLCGNQFVAETAVYEGRQGIKFAVFYPPIKTGQEIVVLFIHGVICVQLNPSILLPVAYKDGYTTLFNCLARNGFVCVSVQPDPDNNNQSTQGRADRMKLVLEDVHIALMENDLGPLTNRSIVLMGHSRGGEAAILAAGLIGMSNTFDVQIRAVIALAPAAGAPSILPATVPNFLAIVGTLDADVRYEGVRGTFFTEITGQATNKYLVGIVGGTHIAAMDSSNELVPSSANCEYNLGMNFFQNNFDFLIPNSSYRAAQARLVSAFLRWKIFGQDGPWSGYFCNRGLILPGTITIATVMESTEQAIGGQAFVGPGFANHLAGQISKESITNLYSTFPNSNAYRLQWTNNNGILRLLFTTTISPTPMGALLVDIGIITIEDPELLTVKDRKSVV